MGSDLYKNIINHISGLKYLKNITDLVGSNKKNISVKLLAGSLKTITIAALSKKIEKQIFIIAPGRDEAEEWYQDLSLFIDEENLAYLVEPKSHVRIEAENLDDPLVWLVDGLSIILKNKRALAITTPDIFNLQIPEPENIQQYRTKLTKGMELNFDEFAKDLALHGFDRKDFVSTQGDMAVRGGIIDIFPFGWDNPIRIEFWGDNIESVREFNTLSQRSIREHKQIEFIANVFHSEQEQTKSTIYKYLSSDNIFVLDNPDIIESQNNEFSLPEDFIKIYINKLGNADVNIQSSTQPSFHGQIKNLALELRQLSSQNVKIFLTADGDIQLNRLQELVDNALDYDFENDEKITYVIDSADRTRRNIYWLNKTLTQGFIFDSDNIACFCEHQIFDRIRSQVVRKVNKQAGGITLRELKQLHKGDYVVHADKGIARFDGLDKITLGGSLQDCVRLIFADGDILYVNLNYIYKISKYSAQEGILPKLSKLGSTEWLRKKERTKRKLKDIARELIKLYAERKMQPGISYPSDTLWQKEFEASFMYEDTPDQARTTIEVKEDMENNTPMDRLVCGDVGFGKTEIAIRAAFKAVQAGKQVVILVPTTILAQQHYFTFTDRLRRYPVIIEVLSRFRTTAQQKIILERAKEGKIDILIGTHRLLSKDVQLKDLGLLIIDEEHRFGVGAKEKIRQFRATVDTLTLTATPIPRTLNFSLMGARDLSIIETPPRNRLPVITEIIEWNDDLIIRAINEEVKRKGQVFFVSDKVEDIYKIAKNLQMQMPHIKFNVAHGQLPPSQLEKIMENFIEHKFDVLVTTKIVESGLDIPNANTILINRSQNFGLAELYQLRGRVGRSNIQAYCYLIIPSVRKLGTNALKRLQALEEFTELGSGFQLALKDLEIRGAGNLLGPEQSGYINEMGFELYQRILDEAVNELKVQEFSNIFSIPEKVEKKFLENDDIAIELDSDALIPPDYIESETERYYFYKQLYNERSNLGLQKIIDEMRDRFGKIPHKVNELIFVVKLRIAALGTGFTKVVAKNHKLTVELPNESNAEFFDLAFPSIYEYVQEIPNAKFNKVNNKLILDVPLDNRDQAVEILWKIKKTVEVAV